MVACMALALVAGCRTPPQIGLDERAATTALLADLTNKKQLTAFMGPRPPRCFPASAEEELCEWESVNWEPGPRSLADAIGSRDRIRLICVVPADGSARRSDSCSVYPMRSNRRSWTALETSHPKRRRENQAAVERNARYRAEANRRLDEARNIVSLSRVVGQVPNKCEPASIDTYQLCVWYSNARTYGHGILMAAIGAKPRQQVLMRCEIPISGTARDPSSCHVQIGSASSR
jgi:hypothetical protein